MGCGWSAPAGVEGVPKELQMDPEDGLPGLESSKQRGSRRVSAAEHMAHNLPGRNTTGERVAWGQQTKLLNQVQLTTYPDCIGDDLKDLDAFMAEHLKDVIGGAHILPFYPSSADRGFAPLTYKKVSPEFGDWSQIQKIAARGDLCVDFMVNHISAQSDEFKDFVKHGDRSKWAELFIRYDKFWGGEPSAEELGLIYTRKPRPPFREIQHPNGKSQKVWCTFDYEQIDIDAFSKLGTNYINDQLSSLCKRGANLIRLDAFGYTTKRRGTNCFFVEPEVWQLLDRLQKVLKDKGVETLAEVHEHYTMQKQLAERGLWVYDFALPMLTLHALFDGVADNLKAWFLKCPRNQITTLDTHDGLGVVDVADLMTQSQIDRTKENIKKHGANYNMRFNTAKYGNLDIYQINCTYYSAVGNRDDWYLLARAIQFFTPGIPLVYYVGLLAGENDIELVESTKVGRDINRHHYSLEEAVQSTQRPVVKVLFELCRFRNHHPAFNGLFQLMDTVADIRSAVKQLADATVAATGELGSKPSLQKDFSAEICGISEDVVKPLEADNAKGWKLAASVLQSIRPQPKPVPPSRRLGAGQAPSFRRFGEHVEEDEDISQEDRLFQPYSAALANQMVLDPLLPPAASQKLIPDGSFRGSSVTADAAEKALAAVEGGTEGGDGVAERQPTVPPGGAPTLAQVRSLSMYRPVEVPENELPPGILVMKWTNDNHWAVLEANMETKQFRILFSDPRTGAAKAWKVTDSLAKLKGGSEEPAAAPEPVPEPAPDVAVAGK